MLPTPEDYQTWFGITNHGHQPSGLLTAFLAKCRGMDRPRVLELGTLRSNPEVSTHHKVWVPNAAEYLGTDIAPGPDVDIVADVHRLSRTVGREAFDAVVSCSTFEHFKYPHVAAHEVMKALKVGGVAFIQTHHAFPLHAYPYDYFRFSQEALAGLFGTRMGFRTLATDYEYAATVHSLDDVHTRTGNAFLNVRLYGEKVGPTPDEYVYELDTGLEG